MSTSTELTLREAYLFHAGEWVVMDLTAPERGEDWEQRGVVVYHGRDKQEAHAVARAEFSCSSNDEGKLPELVVFQGTPQPMPGDHFRRILESLYYRRDLDPRDLEL